MNTKIVYFSPTGTTEKVVNQLASYFENRHYYDLTLSKNRNKRIELDSEDLLIIGLPVYAGRLPEVILNSLKLIKGDASYAIIVVVYGNRDYDDALLELKDVISEQNFIPVAAGAFIGEHSYTNKVGSNRPDESDYKIIHDFILRIKDKLSNPHIGELFVKGNKPYRHGIKGAPFGPRINDRCTRCGICVANCPMDALEVDDHIRIHDERCIRCHSCIKKCPASAISFDERVQPIREFLETNYKKRKEPELFI